MANVSVPVDIDADGDLDVIVPMSRGYRSGVDTRYSFQVFENIDGDLTYSPTLTSQTPFVAGARRSENLLLKRNNSEVFVTVAHDTAIEAETRYDIPWRDGDLTFTSVKPFGVVTKDLVTNTETWSSQKTNRFSAVNAHSMAVGDINGDGMEDVLVGDFGGVFALLQTESGPFKRLTTPLMGALNGWVDPTLTGATPGLLIDMGMGDLNGDGLADLVVGWGHATVISRVFFNDRTNGFTTSNSVALPASVYGANNSLHLKTWIEDVDGDGDNDLMILQSRYEPYYGGNYLQLLINDGKGHLTDETSVRLGDPNKNPDTFANRLQWTDCWQVTDFNKDGALDIMGLHPTTGKPFYYLNDGHGTFSLLDITIDQNSQILSWADFDRDGKIESLIFNSYWTGENSANNNVFSTYEIATLKPPVSSRAFDLSGSAGIVAKTLGVVFGASSVSNQSYVGIGLSLVDGGMTFEGLLDLALDARLGGERSNSSVVRTLYTNLVGHSPSQEEINSFSSLISSGQYSQVSLAKFAADLNLNSKNIDLVGLSQYGLDYVQ
jgi:hypothetical protein